MAVPQPCFLGGRKYLVLSSTLGSGIWYVPDVLKISPVVTKTGLKKGDGKELAPLPSPPATVQSLPGEGREHAELFMGGKLPRNDGFGKLQFFEQMLDCRHPSNVTPDLLTIFFLFLF